MARLGDICEILNGYAFKSEQYVEEGIRIIRIANVQKGYLEDSSPVYYPSDCREAKKYSLLDGDMLMSLTGNVGRVALLSSEFLPATLNQRVACLRVKDPLSVNKACLFHFLNSDRFESECIASSKGVAQKNMSTEWLKEYEIHLPSMDEQWHIVKSLDQIAKLVNIKKQQLARLDELIRSRFVEMFGDPTINEMHWELAPLSTCLQSIDTGTSFVCDAKPRSGTWPAVLKLSAVTYGFYHPEENKAMIDEQQFVKDSAVKIGDLLFTRKNTPELVGMCAYVYDTPANLMMPDLIFRLNTSDRCNKVFLWQLINHDLFRGHIRSIATGKVNV